MKVLRNLGLVLLASFALTQPTAAREKGVELPNDVHTEISRLSQEGDEQSERGNYGDAIATYVKALELLPEPITDWEACTWLLTAIGDTYFRAESYEQARGALSDAMHCPGAIGNPFIHLRLGQAQFELGNLTRANDELTRAYMGAGKEIFEDEDPKYFAHLKTVLLPPANGEW